jgi:class 3 adenylate cyclase
MNESARLRIFLMLFLALNLAFVPLMASYGLSVCPVLRVGGFALGCVYSGVFIAIVYSLNTTLILLNRNTTRAWLYPLIYVIATAIAITILQHLLKISHAGSMSRGPQILLLTSLLLGITQYYGLVWVKQNGIGTDLSSINKLWRSHSHKVMQPIFAMALVLIHFALSQKALAKQPLQSMEDMANDGFVITMFLVGWLCVTYLFHFLAERDSVLKIASQLKRIEEGDFSQIEVFKTWGLWLFLSQRLRDFGQTMRERTYLVKSFSRFVARDVVERATQEELHTAEGEGESVELTIIMTDIRGFTRISDDLPADKIIVMLNSYFNMVIDVFVKYGIHIDKFIGDGILAYVDPLNNTMSENEMAVRAIEEILQRLSPLNQQLKSEGLPEIHIGGGIHRGTVIRGLIGSSQKLEHTIIGDPVNRAARLESLTKEFGVQLITSDKVYNSLPPSTQRKFRPLGLAKVKGIEEDLTIFGF